MYRRHFIKPVTFLFLVFSGYRHCLQRILDTAHCWYFNSSSLPAIIFWLYHCLFPPSKLQQAGAICLVVYTALMSFFELLSFEAWGRYHGSWYCLGRTICLVMLLQHFSALTSFIIVDCFSSSSNFQPFWQEVFVTDLLWYFVSKHFPYSVHVEFPVRFVVLLIGRLFPMLEHLITTHR